MQNPMIVNNPNPLGQKDKLLNAGIDDAYDQAHRKFHPTFSSIQQVFGFYDIFLVDAATAMFFTQYLKN